MTDLFCFCGHAIHDHDENDEDLPCLACSCVGFEEES